MRETGIQYTLATALASLALNPTGWTGAGYYIKNIEVQSSLRTASQDRPQQHGSYIDPGFEGGIGVQIECYMLHAGAASRQTLTDAAMTVLRDMTRGGGVLTWTPQDATAARRLTGLSLAGPTSIKTESGTVKNWMALLKCERPYSESAVATTVDSSSLSSTGTGLAIPMTIPFSLTASGGGTLTYSNTGSVPVRPVLRMYGPATAPSCVNVTTGQRLVFGGSIAAGEFWDIDLFDRSVKLNGSATNVAPLRTIVPASSTWFELGVGSSTLQMTCSGYDSVNTKLRAFQRSAWG